MTIDRASIKSDLVIDVAEIAQRLEALEHKVAAAESERDQYRKLYLEMMERCRKLERGLIGPKSERHAPEEQLSLSVLDMVLGARAAEEVEGILAELRTEEVRAHTRQKPTGRKPIAEGLPRVDIIVVPPEVEREGTDAFDRIGEEVSEVLERRPASLVVARVVRPKYVRKDRDRAATEVIIGDALELPIPRGLAGPGMLADTIVRRWQDHLPLNRLEDIYARDGLDLSRSTMCGWHTELAELVRPLIAAMRADAFEQPYLCVDATGVLVQAKYQCRNAHFWVMVAPERHVLFEYTRQHDGDTVDDVLAGYKGYLVADAHSVYDHLYRQGDVVEVNCWAHARRYFHKSLGSDPDRAKIALGLIGSIFQIERSLVDAPRKKRELIRGKRSRPIIERFFDWCDAEAPKVLDETPISAGIRYARNQRIGLSRFLEDGRLPVHNNISELHLRRQAVGRKNWLFVGSDEGGAANAAFTSLLASCRLHDVEPWSYLRDLFCLLPSWPVHRVLDLAPLNWPTTAIRDDVRTTLGLNPFRALTILAPP